MPTGDTIWEEVLRDTYIPSVLVLLLGSVVHVALTTLITAATRTAAPFRKTLQRWSRALWLLQQSAFVLVSPTRDSASETSVSPRSPRERHRASLSAAAEATSASQPLLGLGRTHGAYGSMWARGRVKGKVEAPHAEEREPMHLGSTSFFRDLDASQSLTWDRDELGLPSSMELASPVFAEVLQQSCENVRLESQRLILPFNKAFMILSACKCFVMVVWVHYHFVDIVGGWRRLCVCGVGNIMAGAVTPVLCYALTYLLPVDGTPGPLASSAISAEETKDSVFIVQLLLQISRVELDDLPTVLVQGTAFVVFTAVFLPVVITLGFVGAVAYLWLLVLVWGLWLIGWRWYYSYSPALSESLVSTLHHKALAKNKRSVSSRTVAFVGSLSEFGKAFAVKAFTLWLLQWSIQTTLLLSLGLMETERSLTWSLYITNLAEVCRVQWRWFQPSAWPSMSSFARACFLSALFF